MSGDYATKLVILTTHGDAVSVGIALALARSGCRLALIGGESDVKGVADEISATLGSSCPPVGLVGLDFERAGEKDFDAAVGEAEGILGGIDALVNCYACEGEVKDCLSVSEQEYEKIIRVNAMAPWYLLKAVAKRLIASEKGGSVVFLSQIIGAERGVYPGAAAFGSSLASVQQLVRLAAMELGKYKIRINAVSRGLHLDDKYPVSVGKETAEKLTKEVMPLSRWLDPKNDLASTVLYLVGDDSRYMTGTAIFVDGAQSIVRPRLRSFM